MTILFSPSAGGFFDTRIRGIGSKIPLDAVEVTTDRHAELMQAIAAGHVISVQSGAVVSSAPTVSMDAARSAKIAEIDAARDAALDAGFVFNGVRYDCDDLSVQRITGATVLGILNPAFSTPWITFDNTVVTLSATDLAGLGAAAAQHVATQLFKARALKDEVLAATTVEQVSAINW